MPKVLGRRPDVELLPAFAEGRYEDVLNGRPVDVQDAAVRDLLRLHAAFRQDPTRLDFLARLAAMRASGLPQYSGLLDASVGRLPWPAYDLTEADASVKLHHALAALLWKTSTLQQREWPEAIVVPSWLQDVVEAELHRPMRGRSLRTLWQVYEASPRAGKRVLWPLVQDAMNTWGMADPQAWVEYHKGVAKGFEGDDKQRRAQDFLTKGRQRLLNRFGPDDGGALELGEALVAMLYEGSETARAHWDVVLATSQHPLAGERLRGRCEYLLALACEGDSGLDRAKNALAAGVAEAALIVGAAALREGDAETVTNLETELDRLLGSAFLEGRLMLAVALALEGEPDRFTALLGRCKRAPDGGVAMLRTLHHWNVLEGVWDAIEPMGLTEVALAAKPPDLVPREYRVVTSDRVALVGEGLASDVATRALPRLEKFSWYPEPGTVRPTTLRRHGLERIGVAVDASGQHALVIPADLHLPRGAALRILREVAP